jgi:penicillin-binding protein 1A
MLPPRPTNRRRRVALALLVLLAALGAAVRLGLQSDALRDRVRARVRPLLESRLGPVELGDTFEVGGSGTVTLGPLEIPARSPGAPPVVRIERIEVQPRLGALLSGRVEARQVTLSDVVIEAGPSGEELRALAGRERASPRDAPAPPSEPQAPRAWPELRVEGLRLAFERRERVEWGPLSVQARVEERAEGRQLEATVEPPGGGQVLLSLRPSAEGVSGTLQARALSAGALLSLAEPPLRLEGGELEGEVKLEGRQATFSVAVKGLALQHPQLAPEPVAPVEAAAEGSLRWEPQDRRVTLAPLHLTLGARREVQVDVTGEALGSGAPRFSARAVLRPLTFAQAVAALPPALVPETDLSGQEGTLEGSLEVSGPLASRRDWQVKAKLELPRAKAAGTPGPLAWLRQPFDYRPLTAEGRGRELHLGPDNPAFVPLEAVPLVLVRAVLLSEDAGFWMHPGFDFDSLRTVLLAPKDDKVRGGSTLTQQLAKNLFLSREKTYARKVKEALLTLALESAVPKPRLLELYVNLIEWGPGLYGVGEAARHYFDKPATDLSAREAAFLATIIPNPVRYHFYCTRGELSEAWAKNVDHLLGKLLADGVLTELDYQAALTERLAFACPVDARARSAEAPSAEGVEQP